MPNRTHFQVGWAIACLISALMLASTYVKLTVTETSELGQTFQQFGYWEYRYPLAILDVLLAALFLVPRLVTLSLLLMCGYWGGATAALLTHGEMQELPIHLTVLAALWVSGYLRSPEIFDRVQNQAPPPAQFSLFRFKFGWGLAIMISLFMAYSVFVKLTASTETDVGKVFEELGMMELLRPLALLDLLLVGLFLYPRTSTLGLMLLMSYWGGAMATVLTHAQTPTIQPVVILLLFVSAYFRNPELYSRIIKPAGWDQTQTKNEYSVSSKV